MRVFPYWAAFPALILCLAASSIQAQNTCRLDELIEWSPRAYHVSRPTWSVADRTAMEANHAAVEAIVRKTAYGKPRGFAVTTFWRYGDAPQANRLRFYEYLTLVFLRCNKLDEHGSDITIEFNPDPQKWSESDRPMPDENGDGLYTERVRSEPLFGSTATFGHFEEENARQLSLLFTSGGESPTIPATREEYLRAMIFTLEGKDQARIKEAVAFASKTQYERWLEGAAERKKSNAEMVAGIAASVSAVEAEKANAVFEKSERESGETLKKQDAQERAELQKNIAQLTVPGDKLRAQIAAMTPEERKAPAWVREADLVPAGTPNANAIVRINPAFYRPRSSPNEVRAIAVHLQYPHKEMLPQHQRMFRDFDWEALKRLLTK